MNWEQIRGKWDQFKGKVKTEWAELTDDDIAKIEGNRDRLVGVVKEKYGIAKEEAEKRVKEWEDRN